MVQREVVKKTDILWLGWPQGGVSPLGPDRKQKWKFDPLKGLKTVFLTNFSCFFWQLPYVCLPRFRTLLQRKICFLFSSKADFCGSNAINRRRANHTEWCIYRITSPLSSLANTSDCFHGDVYSEIQYRCRKYFSHKLRSFTNLKT